MKEFNILVVDDDKEIVEVLTKLLTLEGYQVYQAYDGIEAVEIVNKNEINLIFLDVMMPKLNGISAMMKIRENKNIPILILSAKTEESDKVAGLLMGADDYIEKPFNTAELLARVNAQLRRYFTLGASNNEREEKPESETITVGTLKLSTATKEINVEGEYYNLTATEYKILQLLMSNPGRVFSAEQIYQNVWNEEVYSVENTVMVHIRRIREKIEINPKQPKYLKVVWGIGYKIEKEQ